jgi:serine protease
VDAREDVRGREVRARVLTACGLVAVLVAPAAARAASSTGRLSVLVAPERRPHAAAARALAARAGARPDGPVVPQIGLITLRPLAGRSLGATARALRRLPGVQSVAVEHRYALRDVPNDPALSTNDPAAGTTFEWAPQREDFPRAWDITHGGSALVGVIDTGVDGSHPDLAGKIHAAVSFDSTASDGPATTDQSGHGTHVASLACAATGNGVGIAGAGYDCQLVIEKDDLTDDSVAAALVDATDRGTQAINMSFGSDGARVVPEAITRAIDYAVGQHVVLVAAAADNPTEEQGDPANILQPTGTGPQIDQGKGLTVTAATVDDQRAWFAGSGTQISLAAYGAFRPGSAPFGVGASGPPGILAAFPANQTEFEQGLSPCGCRTSLNGDARYGYLMGTSMAAPQVTAAAALVRALNPDISALGVVRTIKQTARRPAGVWTPDLGWGILDAGAALDSARRVDVTPPATRVSAPRRTHKRSVLVRWTGTDPTRPGLIASGLGTVSLYAGRDGRKPHFIKRTARHTIRYRVRPGSVYRFYTLGVDKAGNRERASRSAHTRALR